MLEARFVATRIYMWRVHTYMYVTSYLAHPFVASAYSYRTYGKLFVVSFHFRMYLVPTRIFRVRTYSLQFFVPARWSYEYLETRPRRFAGRYIKFNVAVPSRSAWSMCRRRRKSICRVGMFHYLSASFIRRDLFHPLSSFLLFFHRRDELIAIKNNRKTVFSQH